MKQMLQLPLAIAWLLTAFSLTQAHEILGDGNSHNDWIQGLANSENVPCCGNNDCYPLAVGALQISSDGSFTVEIGGSWFPVPEHSLLRDMSPDGRPWVCPKQEPAASGYMYMVRGVRCLLLPMGA
jgi:hypothetical protein